MSENPALTLAVINLTKELNRFNNVMDRYFTFIEEMVKVDEPMMKLTPMIAKVTEHGLKEQIKEIEEEAAEEETADLN